MRYFDADKNISVKMKQEHNFNIMNVNSSINCKKRD